MEPQFRDNRSVKLDKVLSPDFIPPLGGRPIRNLVIGKDDFLNLIIAMNTSWSMEEFLAKV